MNTIQCRLTIRATSRKGEGANPAHWLYFPKRVEPSCPGYQKIPAVVLATPALVQLFKALIASWYCNQLLGHYKGSLYEHGYETVGHQRGLHYMPTHCYTFFRF